MFENKEQKDLVERKNDLITKCLTLDDCKFAFVAACIEKIMAGVDMPDPTKEPEKVQAEWERFKAEWEKKQEGSETHE